jgi:hypothetical protein
MNHYKPEWSRFVAKFKGHKVSLLDVKSFAAKAVRDGDENAAIRWMRILYENNAKCWKQLLIRSVEDMAMADLTVMDSVLLLKRRLKKRIHRISLVAKEIEDSHQSEWLCIILATMIVCRAQKHRATDHAAIWFRENPTWMPPITQEVFEAARDASKDAAEGKLPAVPDKVWDRHTQRGRHMGRGMNHFKEVASKLKNEATGLAGFVPPQVKGGTNGK